MRTSEPGWGAETPNGQPHAQPLAAKKETMDDVRSRKNHEVGRAGTTRRWMKSNPREEQVARRSPLAAALEGDSEDETTALISGHPIRHPTNRSLGLQQRLRHTRRAKLM